MKGIENFFAVICVFVGDRQNFYLYRCKPGRECTCEVLDQDSDETLNGTVNNTVDHDRTMFLAVSSCVFQFESLRQLEVKLNGTALPGSSDGVFQMEVDLRSVECAVAFVDYVVKSKVIECSAESFGCYLPVLIASHAVFRTGGQLYVIFESEQFVNLVNQVCNALDFIFDLLRCHEDMGIVLVEAAYTHQTVQLAGFLMTMYQANLCQTQRQITVGTRLGFVHENAARAVHRFDCIIFVVDDGGIHVFFVVIPVTGGLPQTTVQDDRGRDFYVSCFSVDFTPVIHQRIFQIHSFWKEERESRAVLTHHKQTEFFSEFSVVTFLCFFDHMEVLFELCFLCECSSVDSLQHLVFLAASPVCACKAGQFEGFNRLCAHQMRACAQIRKFTLAIEADDCVFRQIFDQFYFVRLFFFFHEGNGFCSRQFEALQFQILFYDFLHLCFDFLKILAGERSFSVYIVVESVCDGRSDCKLCLRVQSLDCLCHNMGCSVTECCFSAFIVEGQNGKITVFVDHGTKVFYFAVYFTCTGHSCKAFADVCCDLNDGFRFGVLFGTSIFQCDDHLLYLFLCIFFASVFQDFYTFYSNKKVPSDTLMLSKGTMYFHSPRFHPFCFFKPLHLTITESPGRIGAAQSWSSITFLLKPLHHKRGFSLSHSL